VSDHTLEALLFGVFGLIVLAITIASLRDAAAMRRWPVAKGRVLSSKVEEYREISGAGSASGSHGRITLYRPVVVYEYEADGRRYESDRITQSPGLNRGAPDAAAETVRRYAAGSAVDVRYNPARPSEAVLEPRVPRSWIVALAIAAALLALAARAYVRA
jgi:hypothetical protein